MVSGSVINHYVPPEKVFKLSTKTGKTAYYIILHDIMNRFGSVLGIKKEGSPEKKINDDKLFKLVAEYNDIGLKLDCDFIYTDEYIFIDTYVDKDIFNNLKNSKINSKPYGALYYIMFDSENKITKNLDELKSYFGRDNFRKVGQGVKSFEKEDRREFYENPTAQLDHLGPDMIWIMGHDSVESLFRKINDKKELLNQGFHLMLHIDKD